MPARASFESKLAAASILSQGGTKEQAATAADVTPMSVFRWIAQEDEEFAEARRAVEQYVEMNSIPDPPPQVHAGVRGRPLTGNTGNAKMNDLIRSAAGRN